RHLICLVENEQLRFMKVHSTYDLADVKAAVDIMQSSGATRFSISV
ncbi:alcohol dehydrogenase, partial [Bacillus cereus]|nr:alcohol dehydrogenase [Bacillus cereus]